MPFIAEQAGQKIESWTTRSSMAFQLRNVGVAQLDLEGYKFYHSTAAGKTELLAKDIIQELEDKLADEDAQRNKTHKKILYPTGWTKFSPKKSAWVKR